jgi:uncharacterized membrane protein (TIGR02234 family)
MDVVLAGIAGALDPINVAFIALGVALGILVGAIPGMSAPMAVAIGVPLTYTMSPVSALGFLLGVHKGGEYGGAITSILINTPGEVSSALTALEGYPIARRGHPRKALMMSLYASVAGDVLADMVLIVSAAPLAILALRMGPAEILGVLIFAFAFVASLLGSSVPKGLFSLSLGMLLATVGLDLETGNERLTFGILELQDGLPLVAIAIGVLAFGEVLVQMERYFSSSVPASEAKRIALGPGKDDYLSWCELKGCWRAILRGSVIGTGIGALPGLGASVAAFLAYGSERRASKTPEQFGTGKLEGLAAIESANNAVIGSGLIPLLTLGIPGSATAALIVGAFLIHRSRLWPLRIVDACEYRESDHRQSGIALLRDVPRYPPSNYHGLDGNPVRDGRLCVFGLHVRRRHHADFRRARILHAQAAIPVHRFSDRIHPGSDVRALPEAHCHSVRRPVDVGGPASVAAGPGGIGCLFLMARHAGQSNDQLASPVATLPRQSPSIV